MPPSDEWLSEQSLRLDERTEVALDDMAGGPKRTSRQALASHDRA